MSIQSSVKTCLALLFVGGLTNLSPTMVAPARAENPAPGISEESVAAIASMGKTLLSKQFSFRARLFRAYPGPNGELLHFAQNTKTVIYRPDRLSVDESGDNGSIKMLYNGQTLVLYSVEQNQYTSVSVTGNIDKITNVAERLLKVDLPLVDLLTDDPANSVLSGVISGGQVGTSIIDGVRCRHFFFNQADDLELELWLEDNERALPRRFVVTYRNVARRPNFIAELSDWDFSGQAPESTFVFNPPAGAVQVEIKTSETAK
jgi:hypothetical protein